MLQYFSSTLPPQILLRVPHPPQLAEHFVQWEQIEVVTVVVEVVMVVVGIVACVDGFVLFDVDVVVVVAVDEVVVKTSGVGGS